MAKRLRPEQQYPADLVWSAAATAYRINSGYLKYPEVVDGKIVAPTNRELVKLYLHDQSFITDQDRQYAQRCRADLAQNATMSMLQGRDTQWTQLTAQMCGLETVTTDYEIAVITAAPKSYEGLLARVAQDERLQGTEGGVDAKPGDTVEFRVEPVRSNYSARYNTYYVTAITDDNRSVYFAYRSALKSGEPVQIRGRVKRHADRATQLSRVKLVEQEVV